MEKTTKARIELAKEQILEDVKSGVVPGTVASFSELHEYTDANYYGGLFDLKYDTTGQMVEVGNSVQGALDGWIKNGGLKS